VATDSAVWFTEFFCTFWFVFLIMHAKESRLTSNFKNTILIILSVAIALGAIIFVAGSHTGGCFNPAVLFAQYMMCALHSTSDTCGDYFWLYFTADLFGGILAGFFALMHAHMTTLLTPMGKGLAKADPDKVMF